MALPPHVAVIYDAETLAPLRVYVNEDHEDGAHMLTILPGRGEVIAVLPKSEVRGLDLRAIAEAALPRRRA